MVLGNIRNYEVIVMIIYLVPWLREGRFICQQHYANTAASIGKKVLVISTNEVLPTIHRRPAADKKIDLANLGQ